MAKTAKKSWDKIAYLFHGGGSLGAYQVGVYKGLYENGYAPNWLVGTSIGAINSAIIAGNAPELGVTKLQAFWETIATKMPAVPLMLNNITLERWQHFLSADYTACFGQPGFFMPRKMSPWLALESTADKLSFYDNSELRETLSRFIDFKRINDQKIRLSMGAVRVSTGHLVYFDNTKIEITLDHVMASSALPPGFPAVAIDQQFYWDGGVHSNTQLNLLLCEKEPEAYLCFMVHLFDPYGSQPTSMDDVLKRVKEITYSSHHKQAIYVYKAVHNLRYAIRLLAEQLPKTVKKDPEIQALIALGRSSIVQVARFHCKGKRSDLSSKDYDFSYPTILNSIKSGCDDVYRAMRSPPWNIACPDNVGLVLYELSDAVASENLLFDDIVNYHVTT